MCKSKLSKEDQHGFWTYIRGPDNIVSVSPRLEPLRVAVLGCGFWSRLQITARLELRDVRMIGEAAAETTAEDLRTLKLVFASCESANNDQAVKGCSP